MTTGAISKAPSAFGLLWQDDERAGGTCDLFQLRADACQEFFGKAGPDSAGEPKAIRSVVANQQGAEVAAGAFRECVPPYNEFLGFGDLELDPGAAAPAA